MPERRKKRKSHPLRIAFRWCRIVVLLFIALVIGAILWSNLFGLPRFVESAIRREVQRQGIELQFSKLRLRGVRHLVARDVRLRSGSTNAPVFTVKEAEFIIDYQRLRSLQFELSGLHLTSGQLTLPLDSQTGKSLVVSNINSEIHFVAGNVIEVQNFSAEMLGAKAQVSGELRHLSKFRLGANEGSGKTNSWQRPLLDVVEIAEQLDFKEPPELTINLQADGADLADTRATIMIRSAEATSRWGTVDRLQITSSLAPAASNNAVRGNFLSEIAGFRSQFGLVELLRFEGETLWSRNMEQLLTNSLRMTSGGVDARWFRFSSASATLSSSQENTNSPIRSTIALNTGPIESSGARSQTNIFTADLTHPLPFRTPAAWLARWVSKYRPEADRANRLSGTWKWDSGDVKIGSAEIKAVHVAGGVRTIPNNAAESFLEHIAVPWELAATNIRSGEIEIGFLKSEGSWSAPRFQVDRIDAQLYGGYAKGLAELNVKSRRLQAVTQSAFPYEKLSALLDAPVQRWFAQFEWEKPPYVESDLKLQLPPWTNRWKATDLAKNLEIKGRFDGGGKFRGIPADRAESHFHFTNFLWTLPDLKITRPEGQAQVTYSGNVTNGNFHWNIDSRIDPGIIKPLFPKEHQPAAGVMKFVQPPHLTAEAWGNWDDPARLGVKATLAATNFFVKEQAFTDLRADLLLTNGIIFVTDTIVHRGKEEAHAPYLRIDLTNGTMFVTNIISAMDPYIAMSLVGEEAYDAIDPYRFAEVPTVRVNGIVPLRHWSKADLRFEISGNDFTFWRFRIPHLVGDVHWKADHISFSNVVANFYGGKATWSGYFIISAMDPYIAMSLVGEEAYDAIDPYRFAEVPTVRVNGIVPLRHWSKADLRFEIAGNDFTFWRFRIPHLVGEVHWKADHISFSNVVANFYGGKATWSGYFIIDHSDDTANYSFSATTTNSELKYLVNDLTGRTNHVEGLLDGELVITSANSANERSWNGYGEASIRDGFLWNVPVFGIFSPVLDGIAPGLGSSRVSSGGGTFTITNSVVYTRDMQVKAQGFRLGYKGEVDLDGKLDAAVEAQIFRDAWVVGKLFSIVLWPVSKVFEAKVTGTVDAPKTDLRYVPKFLLAPFRALNSLNDGNDHNKQLPAAKPNDGEL